MEASASDRGTNGATGPLLVLAYVITGCAQTLLVDLLRVQHAIGRFFAGDE